MFLIDTILLVTGGLILLGVLSNKLAAKAGLPALVLFMGIGMLAGSEGLGGIEFEEFKLAHAVGTVALALILFDGGLQTSFVSVRKAWRPASILATLGVLTTAMLTAGGAMWLLGLDWQIALLLGAIISSTDAAAVFSILRGRGLHLDERLSSTLEIESGANDPMAVFLTVMCIELITGTLTPGPAMLALFAQQMGLGLIIGLCGGWAGAQFINRIRLDAAGLYPVSATAIALTVFGLAAELGGSGFLAVYLTGLWIGNQRIIYQRGIRMFHDAAAWTSQIVMFTLLGLLSFPSRLLDVSWESILIALSLTFVARPVSVMSTMVFFGFNWKELLFISWVGLKGAVPIILATFPLMFGIEGSETIFNIVFFVVIFSAITQGWSLPFIARLLGLEKPAPPSPAIHLELTSLEHVNADIIEYRIDKGAPACDRTLMDLPLPEEVHIALLARDKHVLPTKGHTRLSSGDYVFVVHPRPYRPLVDRVFGQMESGEARWPMGTEVAFDGRHTAEKIAAIYGVAPPVPNGQALADCAAPVLGEHVKCGDWTLITRAVDRERACVVSLVRTLPSEKTTES